MNHAPLIYAASSVPILSYTTAGDMFSYVEQYSKVLADKKLHSF